MPGLGQPRLANLQNGSFAPLSLLFYALPTAEVFRFYPLITLAALAGLTFCWLRVSSLGRGPALFGALAFTLMGNLATHVQHPPAIETILWWPAALLCWERYRRGYSGWWLIGAGLSVAFQCFGGAPQYLLYGALVLALWIGFGLLLTSGLSRRRV